MRGRSLNVGGLAIIGVSLLLVAAVSRYLSGTPLTPACGCRKCHPRSSRCEFVFVDETTELVGFSYSVDVWVSDQRRPCPHR